MNDWLSTSKEVFLKNLESLNLEKSAAFLMKAGSDFLNCLLEFLKNPKVPFFLELFSLIISSLFLTLALIYFWKLKILPSKIETLFDFLKPGGSKFSKSEKKKLKEWNKVKELFDRGTSSDLKLSIIEADKLLDEVLDSLNFKGETLKEKLDHLSEEQFPELDELKYAHFIRNKIVHEKNFSLSRKEAEAIISVYENFFRSFDLI